MFLRLRSWYTWSSSTSTYVYSARPEITFTHHIPAGRIRSGTVVEIWPQVCSPLQLEQLLLSPLCKYYFFPLGIRTFNTSTHPLTALEVLPVHMNTRRRCGHKGVKWVHIRCVCVCVCVSATGDSASKFLCHHSDTKDLHQRSAQTLIWR